ncbi:MAG: c-type cytochrome [Magnetococcales bacterium]|nr:c-type cytochrome [Magnetococcales bacterium]MBF0113648.1 c-type cytochrome [Magnetococcales bacterium]
MIVRWMVGLLAVGWVALGGAEERPVAELYSRYCAECHHAERLGGVGPALFPDNLRRLQKGEAVEVIGKGRAATQMPGFAEQLSVSEIASLAQFIQAPLTTIPAWGMAQIQASHLLHREPSTLPDKPQHAADPLNLTMVVELADHHVTVLDGDALQPLVRFPTRFALHGGLKFSPDGRFVFLSSRDGWISKYDLYSLQLVAEVRAGLNTRNLAVSGDGKTVMVANYLPHTLVALEAERLHPVKVIPVVAEKGPESSRVSAVFAAPPRNSFIAALKDLPEVWEIPYNDRAAPIYRATVHDFNNASGEKLPVDESAFPIRRIAVEDYLDDFFFDLPYRHLVGTSRNGGSGQVVQLDVGRKIQEIAIPGMPHLSSGILWDYQGRQVMATPNLKEGMVTVIDMKTWQVVKRIETQGPGFFMRSHENTPYAWVDVFTGPHKDLVHVIDKQSLEIIKTLNPAPGKTSGHVEFTRDGRYALLSIWEEDGALVVYDSQTLQEVKRLPMRKPSGKYNVFNKITRSSGTSH